MPDCIKATKISKRFAETLAVNDLSFQIPEGSVYGFIGPNGSGKTTTLRMILGIIPQDEGSIELFGQPGSLEAARQIGYLPEERGIYRKMSVREVIRYFGELKGGRDLEPEIKQWLQRFELTEWANKKVETLSKGMSQKVQFIATVITRPRVLILDEPFSGLDPVNASILRNAVVDLRKQGTTILFSTHDMATAERMCDRILMIFKGRKVLDGTLQTIQKQYGMDTLRVRVHGEKPDYSKLHGVEKVTDFGEEQELRLKDGSDSQQILQSLASTHRIARFEIIHPTLHDIFVRIAGSESVAPTQPTTSDTKL